MSAGWPHHGGSAAARACSPAQTAPARLPTDSPPVELSAFEVTSNRDVGYQSTNTAEVTRMNTAIADIPMNVTVLNQEFIQDTLARTTEDVLEYVPGFVPTSNNDASTVRGFANVHRGQLHLVGVDREFTQTEIEELLPSAQTGRQIAADAIPPSVR